MNTKIIISTLIAFVCIICACTQTSVETETTPDGELTEQQMQMKAKMKQASLLLTDLGKEPAIVKELKYAADFSLEQGRDEDVFFAELFRDDARYKTQAKTKADVRFGAFKETFRERLSAKAKAGGNTIDPNLESWLVENKMKLYWPYSEDFGDEVPPTISYHPVDNDEEGEGFRPVEGGGYEVITMNDDYAYNNPSLLLVPCEEEPIDELVPVNDNCDPWGGGGGSPSPPPPANNTPPGEYDINEVLLGDAKLTKQYDGVFQGGSEIRWRFADPGSYAIVAYSFSRKDIRKKRRKKIYATIEWDWTKSEQVKELYVWEDDGGSRDDIYKTLIRRDDFYATNRSSAGYGTRDGFRVWYAGGLYWTFVEHGINN